MQHMKFQTSTSMKTPPPRSNSYSDDQEIHRLLRNLNVNYRIHRILPVVPIQSQMNAAHIFRSWSRSILRGLPSYESSVGIATGYGMKDWRIRVRVPVGSRIFPSPCRPDQLWGPPSLLPNGNRRLVPRRKSGWRVKLTSHLQLVLRSRKYESIHPLPHTPSWRSA
jgi:hypothetical protein